MYPVVFNLTKRKFIIHTLDKVFYNIPKVICKKQEEEEMGADFFFPIESVLKLVLPV